MVKNFLRNGFSFLTLKQTDILSAATVIMLMTFASALLGLVRDRLLAQFFTADLVGVYFAAFRLPDFAFQVLIFGALSVAFIPVFTEYWQKNKKEAWFLASSLINLAAIIFICLVVVFFIFIKPLSSLLVPGLAKENPEHLKLLINLTRIILLTQIFFVFSSFFTGILQSFQRFLFPALAAVFYNLGIIIGIIFFSSFGMYGVALGVVLGSILHFLIQLPLVLTLGFRPRFNFSFSHPGIKSVGHLMLPRSIALAASQINIMINTSLASLISLASITFLNFAQHLALVPVNFFGAAIAQAAFPTLSRVKNQNKIEDFNAILRSSFHQMSFLIIPTSMALLILHTPLTRLVFGAKLFSWEATVLTGRTLAFFALGLPAQGATLLLMRGFYALHDTRTPLKIGVFSIVLNIVSSLLFVLILHWPVWSLGLSAALAALADFLLLLLFLNRKLKSFNLIDFFLPILKMSLAASVMAAFLWLPGKIVDQLFLDLNRPLNLTIVTGVSLILGSAAYLFLAWLLEIREAKIFFILLRKVGNWRQVLSQSEEIIETEP